MIILQVYFTRTILLVMVSRLESRHVLCGAGAQSNKKEREREQQKEEALSFLCRATAVHPTDVNSRVPSSTARCRNLSLYADDVHAQTQIYSHSHTYLKRICV